MHRKDSANTEARATSRIVRKEPGIAFRHHDRIEPGEYPAYCRSAHTYRDDNWKRWLCALQFDILDDSRLNTIAQLTKFFNLGAHEKPRVTSRRSHYRRAWIDANGGHLPRRSQNPSPAIFVHRMARVLVKDVQRDFRKHALTEEEVYSVIDTILGWDTGKAE
jgi:hypothetical protein